MDHSEQMEKASKIESNRFRNNTAEINFSINSSDAFQHNDGREMGINQRGISLGRLYIL